MSRRAAAGIAWTLVAATLALSVASPFIPAVSNGSATGIDEIAFGLLWLVFAGVGAVIVSRRPEVSLGWLFCLFPLAFQVWVVAGDYAIYGLDTRPGSLPAAEAAAWIASVALVPVLVLAALLLLLYPSGRATARGTRVLVRAVLANGAALLVARAITPGPVTQSGPVDNPLGVEALGGVVEPLVVVTTTAAILLVIASLVSVFVRRRAARGIERRQLDWFAYAAAVLATAWIVGGAAQEAGLNDGAGSGLIYVVGVGSLPIAMGVAILRYRLYDLGLVVRRTLVYGALTATLAGIYLGLVLLSGLAMDDSDFSIAASTLAVAGLFRPVRARIQGLVDRRFYRRRYDAERTLARFSGRLRDELDIDALSGELRRVVADSVQPAHVSVWLREGEA